MLTLEPVARSSLTELSLRVHLAQIRSSEFCSAELSRQPAKLASWNRGVNVDILINDETKCHLRLLLCLCAGHSDIDVPKICHSVFPKYRSAAVKTLTSSNQLSFKFSYSMTGREGLDC